MLTFLNAMFWSWSAGVGGRLLCKTSPPKYMDCTTFKANCFGFQLEGGFCAMACRWHKACFLSQARFMPQEWLVQKSLCAMEIVCLSNMP
jgi:hypothetical protein